MMALPSAQQLRYLIALYEMRHFGRAAESCSVTQSTLSAGILTLERQLDVQILDRTVTRQVVFTPVGRELVKQARQALFALEQVQNVAEGCREPMAGTLRVGMIPTICPFLLAEFKEQLAEEYPRLDLYVIEDLTDRLMERLAFGKVDAAIIALPCLHDFVEVLPLWKDPLYAALPIEHPLAQKEEVRMEELQSERMIMLEDGHCLRDQVLTICKQQKSWSAPWAASADITATSLYTLVEMVACGLGVALIPEMAVGSAIFNQRRVKATPITREDGAFRRIAMAWRSGAGRGQDIKDLSRLLLDMQANHQFKL